MGIKDVKPITSGLMPASMPAALFMSGAKGAAPAEGAKGLEALSLGAGRAVLSSSQGVQPSYIRKDRTMSIFTYHLIEALTGHARPAEGATEVLVSDVMGHVWRHVPESTRQDWGLDQQPDYQVSGNFPVALLLGGKGLAKGAAAPDPLAPPAATGPASVFDQRGQTVHGPQTNIAGNVHGPVFSGQFSGPVAVGGGEAVDLRGAQGAIYKPSGPVEQQFGNRITGDGNVIGNHSRSTVIKQTSQGASVDEFRRLIAELQSGLARAGLDEDTAAAVAADVRTVEEQAGKSQPRGPIIVSKLRSITEILTAAAGTAAATGRLLPLAQKAAEWAGQLFG